MYQYEESRTAAVETPTLMHCQNGKLGPFYIDCVLGFFQICISPGQARRHVLVDIFRWNLPYMAWDVLRVEVEGHG